MTSNAINLFLHVLTNLVSVEIISSAHYLGEVFPANHLAMVLTNQTHKNQTKVQ